MLTAHHQPIPVNRPYDDFQPPVTIDIRQDRVPRRNAQRKAEIQAAVMARGSEAAARYWRERQAGVLDEVSR
jgi:hypothetical protein